MIPQHNRSVLVPRTLGTLTWGVVVIGAVIPGQNLLPRSKHVVKRPSNDHVVVDITDESHDDHAHTDT
jgi:hypothetical protein